MDFAKRCWQPLVRLCIGISVFASSYLGSAASGFAQADLPDTDLLAQGQYVARASGCMSCHQEDLSGGYEVETPMGTIVAPNISPSDEFGIGHYARDDLARVLRDGAAPGRRLYPAMPYASFRGMSDADIDALYAWLMDQAPVHRVPEAQTQLPFPFNIRTGVLAWNMLFLGDRNLPRTLDPNEDPTLSRGAYLVDHLGHCGECHTPRNDFYAMRDDLYLAGEVLEGWLAPNLTPHPVTGIGTWSEQDIVDYLARGHAARVAQAAGPMADFVQHSTRHLDTDDLRAMAAYLKSLPAIDTRDQDVPAVVAPPDRVDPQFRYGQIRQQMSQALRAPDAATSEQLYLQHCAACHGVDGHGQPQAFYPPLVQNAALRRADARNLLLVLAHGVPAGKLERAPAMPGFADELSHDEIALLANYSRVAFGGRSDSDLTAVDVARALSTDEEMPMPLRILQVAAWVAVAGLALLAVIIIWLFVRRRRHKNKEVTSL